MLDTKSLVEGDAQTRPSEAAPVTEDLLPAFVESLFRGGGRGTWVLREFARAFRYFLSSANIL